MIHFYYHPSPNPAKVALMLEECGLDYTLVPVDTRKGEQHDPAFLAVNPNAKTPAIVDEDAPGGPATVFDSNAILLYLAERTGRFLPPEGAAARGELLSWLMFIATGVGPYAGQAVHFQHMAEGENAYAVKRYRFEAWRHWRVLDERLEGRDHVLGDAYTIVDMALWGWARPIPFVLGEGAWDELPHVRRLFERIEARPAAARAAALKDAHGFKGEMDREAREALFPFIKG